jgi:hypothetical protein
VGWRGSGVSGSLMAYISLPYTLLCGVEIYEAQDVSSRTSSSFGEMGAVGCSLSRFG